MSLRGKLTGQQMDISDDGKYVYFIDKQTTHFQSVNGNWKQTLDSATSQNFYENGKLFVYIIRDTLYAIDLPSRKIISFPGIQSYSEAVYPWFICQLRSDKAGLLLLNLQSGKQVP
ncbi:MAG: hypothetical protein J7497_08700, partial [Chitinophagaceae bacterium]|nr:hypothetical protein [Chitinophagaceae bacterium]